MTTRHEFWTDRLGAYLEDDLSREERTALEEHLEVCAECVTVLAELQEVVRRARALTPEAPQRDLWSGIEARLGEDPLDGAVIPLRPHGSEGGTAATSRRRWRWRWRGPGLAAAAVALVALGWTGGTLWSPDPTGPATAGPGAASSASFASTPPEADGPLTRELARLEARVRDGLDGVDPETRSSLLQNLELIDRAIQESLRALQAEPESDYLKAHVDGTRTRKQGYLQRILQTLEAQA